jgi:hypothetical protein
VTLPKWKRFATVIALCEAMTPHVIPCLKDVYCQQLLEEERHKVSWLFGPSILNWMLMYGHCLHDAEYEQVPAKWLVGFLPRQLP